MHESSPVFCPNESWCAEERLGKCTSPSGPLSDAGGLSLGFKGINENFCFIEIVVEISSRNALLSQRNALALTLREFIVNPVGSGRGAGSTIGLSLAGVEHGNSRVPPVFLDLG